MIGTRIGHYRIESQLGAGGMGVVYRAFDSKLERPVAIKVFPDLSATPKTRQRLMHEARSASALNHASVCTVYEVAESGDACYLVMEFVDGRTLADLIPSGGFPVDTVVRHGSQIADALAHAHARGVVHRDLKCANVIVTPDGRVKVLDFGIAQRQAAPGDPEIETQETESPAYDSILTPGTVAGTLLYMAPEALRGELVDGRVDIWALGVMLYEMASATRPFTGSTPFDICGKILHAEPAPLPGRVPAGLKAVIARCLAKQPSDRYPNAGEVRLALEAVQTGAQAATTSSTVARPAPAGKGTLLVLPFTNLAADPESDYFANGLTDEIIADLSNVRHLRVISSTSSMQFKDTTLTVSELAKQLGVEHVLEGSVRRMGDALRVTAKLVEAATDSPIWGNKYSGSLKDVFAIQETLSRSIVDALRVVLSSREAQQLKEHPIPDVRAYEWYLRAKQEMLRFTKESLDRVIECLEQSEAIAGDNALILATKGEAYWQYVNSGISGDVSYLDKADACAERALEIEPRSPHGRRVSALVRVHRGDMPGAFRQLRLALELAPNDPDCLLWGSIVAGVSGQMALAEAWADRLVAVDPVTPFYQLVPGTMKWLGGEYERAWALWSERPGAVMENPLMRLVYGHLAVMTGRADEGRRILEDLARAEPANPFGQLAVIYQAAFDGDAARALAGLTPELIATLESDPQYCWFLAQCCALAGDIDGGIRWVDVAVSRGFINHDVLARLDPFLANLRGDPRYESLMRDVKRKVDAITT